MAAWPIRSYSSARLHSLESFKKWATFGKGWAARVAGVEAKAVAMAVSKPANAGAVLAQASSSAATQAKGAAIVAHTATVTAGAGVIVATSHPAFGILVTLVAAADAIWSAFDASTSGARAAVLAHASAAP